MKYLDLTLPSPAENLACDEALLDWCEETAGDEILRFWESSEYFVVVGYANKVSSEVNVAVCENNEMPIFRRCTGGGTVLQGKGCLNYSLVLKIENQRALQNISTANQFILKRNQLALQPLVSDDIELRGQTDLALVTRHSSLATPKKFSGNSQRRKKEHLLFHGTLLLNFDLRLVEKVLMMPSKQPDYRNNRPHLDFLMNIDLSATAAKAALKEIWGAKDPLRDLPRERICNLATEKYSTRDWNWKF